jgi:hypothetical protein
MTYKTDDEIKDLIERFENCTVTEEEWTHGAHLVAGLWYALHHDVDAATEKMREGIYKLNAAHGVPNTPTRGYHETLTVFWTATIADYIKNSAETSLVALANGLLENYPSSYPLKFYTRELLFSPAARAKYIEPDLRQNRL